MYTSFSSTSSASTSSATTSYTDTFPASAYYTIPPTLLHSGGHAGVAAGVSVGGLAITSIAVAAILYLRRRRSRAAPADVGASQPMLNDENDGTVVQPSPRPPPLTMKLYVRVFMSHAAVIMCPHTPFLTISIHLGPKRPNYVPEVPRRSTISGHPSSFSSNFVNGCRIRKHASKHADLAAPCQRISWFSHAQCLILLVWPSHEFSRGRISSSYLSPPASGRRDFT